MFVHVAPEQSQAQSHESRPHINTARAFAEAAWNISHSWGFNDAVRGCLRCELVTRPNGTA
eukprot:6615636-Alexandrium_andersonii.AAC.1